MTREPQTPEFIELAQLFVDSLYQQALDFDRAERATGTRDGSFVRETLTVAREFSINAFDMDIWTAELDRQVEGARTQLSNFRTWNEL